MKEKCSNSLIFFTGIQILQWQQSDVFEDSSHSFCSMHRPELEVAVNSMKFAADVGVKFVTCVGGISTLKTVLNC